MFIVIYKSKLKVLSIFVYILYILYSTFVCNNKDFWKLHKMYNFPHFPSPTYIHDDTDTELSIQSARV